MNNSHNQCIVVGNSTGHWPHAYCAHIAPTHIDLFEGNGDADVWKHVYYLQVLRRDHAPVSLQCNANKCKERVDISLMIRKNNKKDDTAPAGLANLFALLNGAV